MKIGLIACSNGLGHIRRVVAISSFMLRNGFKGTIEGYLSEKYLKKLSSWDECKFFINHPRVQIIDFQYPIESTGNRSNLYDKNWDEISIPNLDKFDVIWSDNILQVLDQREDAILTGSFFWYEVLKQHKHKNGLEKFIEEQYQLVKRTKPVMAGNEYFATQDVRKLTNFSPVGLYRYSLLFQEKKNAGILLSCGLGGEEEEMASIAVNKIIKNDKIAPDFLFVEPRLLPKKYPSWIKKAEFTDEMFQYCVAVCIRPGLGTVSDALIARNRIFTFSKQDSFEMNHNAKVIEALNVGKKCTDPYHAYTEALKYAQTKQKINEQILRTSHLRTDGVFATTNLILSRG